MRNRELLQEIVRVLDKIEVGLIVRDPGTTVSADAYEGLRKQVAVAAQHRYSQLVQLVQFRDALEHSADIAQVSGLVGEWMEQAGLLAVDDPGQHDLYEVVAGKGEDLNVIQPAYIDEQSGRVIRRGRAEAMSREEDTTPELAEEGVSE